MNRLLAALLAAVFVPAAARGEVVAVEPHGFSLSSSAVVPAPPGEVYSALRRIGDWWSGDHSYSGDAAKMTLSPHPGGCFCELLPDGGWVEHMRVVQVRPGALLRLAGGLGPLQAEGVRGTLSWQLSAEGEGTRIVQTYVVGGFIGPGASVYAPPVDRVLEEQLARLAAHLAR